MSGEYTHTTMAVGEEDEDQRPDPKQQQASAFGTF